MVPPGSGAQLMSTVTAWSDPNESLDLINAFTSPLVGIVPRIFHKVHDLDDSYTYAIGSETAASTELIGAPANQFNGGGDTDETITRLAAVGESVERYSAAWIPVDALEFGSTEDLSRRGLTTVDLATLPLFSDEQYAQTGFRFERPTSETALHWRESSDLATGRIVHVPAQLVHLSAGFPTPESHIGYATSSGLAFHATPIEAVLGGTFELFERDAFVQTWYGQLSLPLIDTSTDPALTRFLRRYCERSGTESELVDMTELTGVPTVLAVTRNRASDVAPIALGAASAPTLARAAASAAVESLQTRNWVKAEQRDGTTLQPNPSTYDTDVVDFVDHICLYAHPDMIRHTEFLTASTHRRDVRDSPVLPSNNPAELLDALLEVAGASGIDLMTVNMTSPDVAEGGGHVFRTFSPQLQPLDVGFRRRYLGGQRLRSHAHSLGLRDTEVTTASINPHPHPFP
ncbi:hypothetical protein CH275_16915 [Rhodococcus sp. 06-235-1A]|nr:hypothetical protein CH275_16915 [Rhodococcus sp. 06-235-1A]